MQEVDSKIGFLPGLDGIRLMRSIFRERPFVRDAGGSPH
jgi:hypothetical protein